MATATTLSLPKPWSDFLKEADAQLSQKVNLHCLGGFVLTALYGIARPTADLDYVSAVPRKAREEVERIAGRESAANNLDLLAADQIVERFSTANCAPLVAGYEYLRRPRP